MKMSDIAVKRDSSDTNYFLTVLWVTRTRTTGSFTTSLLSCNWKL